MEEQVEFYQYLYLHQVIRHILYLLKIYMALQLLLILQRRLGGKDGNLEAPIFKLSM